MQDLIRCAQTETKAPLKRIRMSSFPGYFPLQKGDRYHVEKTGRKTEKILNHEKKGSPVILDFDSALPYPVYRH